MPDNKETDSKNGLSSEDMKLWEDVTRDVKPLEGREKRVADSRSRKKVPFVASSSVTGDVALPYGAAIKPKRRGRDVDRKTERRLQKGEMPIDGKLDMHGMNQDEARRALFHFIQNAYLAGKRCVLVVTGKGSAGRISGGQIERGAGVLRRNTPQWLREDALADIVLRAVEAQPRDGGAGALYVYLRRNRD